MENSFGVNEAGSLLKELRGSFMSKRTQSYDWRISQLKGILKICDDHEQDVVDALRQDLCKPELESIVYEVTALKSSCEFVLKNLKHWIKSEKASTPIVTFPSSAEIIPDPLGVVLVISAWNYPFLLSLDPMVGAIAAGNCVVLKPSEISPATSSLLAKLVDKYLDSSCIKVVEASATVTSALLEQKWDKIFYTGSGRVGRIVMAAAAKHLTPVTLELGGKSPVLIDSGINFQVAARRIISGKWGFNNGQACVSADYVVTTRDCASKLVDVLKDQLEKSYGKNPLESSNLSRIVNHRNFDRLMKLLEDGKISDKIVYGGERDREKLKMAPTILLDVPRDSLIMNEEIFGPLLPIVIVNDVEDGFDIINTEGKPLAAYLFSNNRKLKAKFVSFVSAGAVVINDVSVHLAVASLPFGGVGESGIGAYHGKFSFDAFSHKKAVLYRGVFPDLSVRYPPYTKWKIGILRALLNGNVFHIVIALLGWFKR